MGGVSEGFPVSTGRPTGVPSSAKGAATSATEPGHRQSGNRVITRDVHPRTPIVRKVCSRARVGTLRSMGADGCRDTLVSRPLPLAGARRKPARALQRSASRGATPSTAVLTTSTVQGRRLASDSEPVTGPAGVPPRRRVAGMTRSRTQPPDEVQQVSRSLLAREFVEAGLDKHKRHRAEAQVVSASATRGPGRSFPPRGFR